VGLYKSHDLLALNVLHKAWDVKSIGINQPTSIPRINVSTLFDPCDQAMAQAVGSLKGQSQKNNLISFPGRVSFRC
jgi:hypothetical protein